MTKKTFNNVTVDQAKTIVPDIEFYGDPSTFKCLSKAWSVEEGWMKSTKAMNVPNGVVIQVTTQMHHHVAEAVTYVPGIQVCETSNGSEHDYELRSL